MTKTYIRGGKEEFVCPECGKKFLRVAKRMKNPLCHYCQEDNRYRGGLSIEEAREIQKIRNEARVEKLKQLDELVKIKKNKIRREKFFKTASVVLKMKKEGATFREIGKALGFTGQRAQQIWKEISS